MRANKSGGSAGRRRLWEGRVGVLALGEAEGGLVARCFGNAEAAALLFCGEQVARLAGVTWTVGDA